MFRSKENHNQQTKSNFIKYLYQEGIRKGINKSPDFYPEIIKFIETPLGMDAFQKFSCIDSHKFGNPIQSTKNTLKRMF